MALHTTVKILQANMEVVKLQNDSSFCSLKICDKTLKSAKKKRNVQSDIFTILLLIYHTVQWMKVKNTLGQSEELD